MGPHNKDFVILRNNSGRDPNDFAGYRERFGDDPNDFVIGRNIVRSLQDDSSFEPSHVGVIGKEFASDRRHLRIGRQQVEVDNGYF